jgi:hypothetical protein
MTPRKCIGPGCQTAVTDPRFDLCDPCWMRLRDLVDEAAQDIIDGAELILKEAAS